MLRSNLNNTNSWITVVNFFSSILNLGGVLFDDDHHDDDDDDDDDDGCCWALEKNKQKRNNSQVSNILKLQICVSPLFKVHHQLPTTNTATGLTVGNCDS